MINSRKLDNMLSKRLILGYRAEYETLTLLSSNVMDYITLNDDLTITELRLNSKLAGQTIIQASLRKKFKINIIALQHGEKTTSDIEPDMVLGVNDIVVVVGKKEHILKFEKFLASGH